MIGFPLWKLGGGALIIALLVVSALYHMERRHSGKLRGQLAAATAELQRISTAKDEQRTITRDRIVEVERMADNADRFADRIERAPLPGNCETPEAILGSDI